MKGSATVKFRGEEHEVSYQDYGYESDTNAHVIEWDFVNAIPGLLIMTEEEEQSVYDQLYKISEDSSYDDQP